MVDIREVAENVYLIDNEVYGVKGWGSVYLLNEERKALIDTGPANSAPVILDGMKRVGIGPEDISYIIATHIHLDHAGGAGFLLQKMPRAQLIVHGRGAKHLINPSKLVASMISVQGEKTMQLFGEVVPVEESRVRIVADGDRIDLNCEQILRIMDAPGHAPHELFISESRNNGVFTGDGAGMYLDGIILPLTPPPSFDAETYIATLEKLAGLEPSRIYFAHYGVTTKVTEYIEKVIEVLREEDDFITRAVEAKNTANLEKRLITARMKQLALFKKEKTEAYRFAVEHIIPMNVAGYLKYYQEKHGVSLS